jgi:hypothetical protein
VDPVNRFSGQVVPSSGIIRINRLAILALVVDDAIAVHIFWQHTHQWPLLEALDCPFVAEDAVVANEELVVALVIHIHTHF